MLHHDPEERRERIDGLIQRYRNGEFSEAVFTASLKAQRVRRDNISALVSRHRTAFVESLPFKRGQVS